MKYHTWIDEYSKKHPNTRGMCAHATEEMQKVFPELVRVRGHVYNILNNKSSPHWWLKDDVGNIIDPTAKQFGGILEYDEWDETKEEPCGKCLNCGEYCYDNRFTCSDICAKEFAASLESSTFG